MDYREETFRRRFENASKEFGVRPNQVVSLKLRENVNTSEYREFFHVLEREMGLRVVPSKVDLQGQGYIVADHKVQIFLVEHESGLEILYAVGAIASIIDMIPRIIQAWRFLHIHIRGHHGTDLNEIEIRRIDQHDKLVEEHIPDVETNDRMLMGYMNPASFSIKRLLETEMDIIVSQIQSLTTRVEKLEKSKASMPKKRIATKKTTGTKNKING
jgi:hypothetical protein